MSTPDLEKKPEQTGAIIIKVAQRISKIIGLQIVAYVMHFLLKKFIARQKYTGQAIKVLSMHVCKSAYTLEESETIRIQNILKIHVL